MKLKIITKLFFYKGFLCIYTKPSNNGYGCFGLKLAPQNFLEQLLILQKKSVTSKLLVC